MGVYRKSDICGNVYAHKRFLITAWILINVAHEVLLVSVNSFSCSVTVLNERNLDPSIEKLYRFIASDGGFSMHNVLYRFITSDGGFSMYCTGLLPVMEVSQCTVQVYYQ